MAYEDDRLVLLKTSGLDLTDLKGYMGAPQQRRAQGSGGCSYNQMVIRIRTEELNRLYNANKELGAQELWRPKFSGIINEETSL